MEKKLLGLGALAGAFAGLLAFVFARIFAEPVIQKSIDYESARDAAQNALDKAAGLPVEPPGPDLVSRAVQSTLGIGAGMILFGAAMGVLFAVAYSICIGRTGRVRPRPLALLVATAGFLGFYLVPFVKYPANPPAVGHTETIAARSGLYLIMVACSLIFLFFAVYAGQKLTQRTSVWNASLIAGGGFIVAIGIVMLLLPPLGHLHANLAEYGRHATETPVPLRGSDGQLVFPGFPADVLYRFRLYSIGAQLIMWTTIALVFAPYAERLLRPAMEPVEREPVAV
jgi:hypothetical protein